MVAMKTVGASRMTLTTSSMESPVMLFPWMSRIWSPVKMGKCVNVNDGVDRRAACRLSVYLYV